MSVYCFLFPICVCCIFIGFDVSYGDVVLAVHAAVLYVFEFQILRFDCFGVTDGHCHLLLGWPAPTSEDRIWLPEPNATAQVERTMFELTKNVTYYLQRHNDERVRRLQLESEAWSMACTRARDKMLHFLCTVPELADVK
jgi:hypothetical protein